MAATLENWAAFRSKDIHDMAIKRIDNSWILMRIVKAMIALE